MSRKSIGRDRALIAKQIAHLRDYQLQFNELMGRTIDVEEYFGMYSYLYPDLYERICRTLDIEPKDFS